MADPQKNPAPTKAPAVTKAPAKIPARTKVQDGFLVVTPLRYINIHGERKDLTIGAVARDLSEEDRKLFEANAQIQPNFDFQDEIEARKAQAEED